MAGAIFRWESQPLKMGVKGLVHNVKMHKLDDINAVD